MDIHDLNLLPEINMQYQTPSQPQRYIRRSLSTRFPPPDFFETLNIPDEVIEHVFKYLTISELVNVMSVCRRFDRIGKKSRFWRHVDLSGITITQFALHHILERRTEIMKLTSAVIFKDLTLYPLPDSSPFNNLVFLDLSYVTYDDISILTSILKRTAFLQVLNISQFRAVTEEICEHIARNGQLRYLNMEMCERFPAKGIYRIMTRCARLEELNMGWSRFEPTALEVLCHNLPSKLKRLNLSGMEKQQLSDNLVEMIVKRCAQLVEIDLSDCGEITERAFETISTLKKLLKLSLCRCHGIEPMYFVNVDRLDQLNVHGCVTDQGVEFLRTRLAPTMVNETPFTSIARPSPSSFRRM